MVAEHKAITTWILAYLCWVRAVYSVTASMLNKVHGSRVAQGFSQKEQELKESAFACNKVKPKDSTWYKLSGVDLQHSADHRPHLTFAFSAVYRWIDDLLPPPPPTPMKRVQSYYHSKNGITQHFVCLLRTTCRMHCSACKIRSTDSLTFQITWPHLPPWNGSRCSGPTQGQTFRFIASSKISLVFNTRPCMINVVRN